MSKRANGAAAAHGNGDEPELPPLLGEGTGAETASPEILVPVHLVLPAPGVTASPGLVASIRGQGLLHAVVLQAVADTGRYRILAGRKRVDAHRRLERETVRARVFAADAKVSPAVIALVENLFRNDNPVVEAEAIAEFRRAGYSTRRIAAELHVGRKVIEKYERLAALDPVVRAGVEAGTVKASVAEAAAKLSKSAQERLADVLAEKGKLTGQDLREERAATAIDVKAQLGADFWAEALAHADRAAALHEIAETAERAAPSERVLVLALPRAAVEVLERALVTAPDGQDLSELVTTAKRTQWGEGR